MNRRGFMAGILAAGFAPAAIGSGVLMPIRRLVVPRWYEFHMPSGTIVQSYFSRLVLPRGSGLVMATFDDGSVEARTEFGQLVMQGRPVH